MIGDESQGETFGTGFDQQGAQSIQETITVLIIDKDRLSFNSAEDNVMERTGSIYAGLAWHGGKNATTSP